MKLFLFDIDGTLVLSGGAGKRAMSRAFADLYGFEDVMDGIPLSGRTDDRIMMDAYAKAGIEFSRAELERFKERYFSLLPTEMAQNGGDKRVMPGVKELLSALSRRNDSALGLLTGNWERSGRIKIAYFGLDSYFPFGAFSDDASDREALVPIAVERFRRLHGFEPSPREIYVIGDTPADILCAKPHGVVSVAVAAAAHSVDELRKYEPDLLFPDLTDLETVLKAFNG
ncbi:MAG: haloacid dehalogenase-like hydrolase [candidate division KSB1 bacterium]|nr:haloacid dehalogenase-like hydrolase [candidate division KSB1 bacterium]